jgi:hypothetical protein
VSEERLPKMAAAAFLAGLLLLLLVDAGIGRILGIPLTFVGLGLGVAAIATPGFLERDRDTE